MEHRYVYRPKGTCSVEMDFVLDDEDHILRFQAVGGCDGNLKGISALIQGRKAEEIIPLLEGVRCGFKNTSCPDQLAQGLKQYLKEKEAK